MNRRVLLAGIAITLPVVAILFANLGRDPHRVRSPLIGRPAPSFALKEVRTGRVVSLESLRGRPVVLNFWATWCVPCFAEHQVLVGSAASLGASAQFLGVVYEDTEEKILRFLREHGSTYPSLMDEDGKTAIAYGIFGVPETYFLDRNGVIVAKYEGPLTVELLSENLRKAGVGQ